MNSVSVFMLWLFGKIRCQQSIEVIDAGQCVDSIVPDVFPRTRITMIILDGTQLSF